ncbi:unnamed protein product [Phaedon cochleariae]|uniref:Ankyrin repeat domain-containing protein 40 n=1 Tax=Phaedon cochleariae TaxID=80249 RepID=A0A9P0GRH9_PHACE|nr:unnamed protein product [Phaedon cochleariae]
MMAEILEEKLREAACLGDVDAVTTLLSQNIDVNSQNSMNGWTALHWACKRGNEDIAKILIANGADQHIKDFKGLLPFEVCSFSSNQNQGDQVGVKFTPNYLRNPPLSSQVELGNIIKSKHTDFGRMPTTSLPTSQNDDLVLKIRVQGSSDPDFIEIEIPRWKLTYSTLLKICCSELAVQEDQVDRIRKLPDTRLRRDSDVKRLRDYQALEIVLNAQLTSDKSINNYQSISTCKDQTILY